MKKISTLLIIAGLVIAVFPFAKTFFEQQEEARLMAALEEQMKTADVEESTVEEYQALQDVFVFYEEEEQGYEEPAEEVIYEDGELLGRLEIPKISAEMPIIQGASDENLKSAAALLDGTSSIGTIGNAAIAAHRSYTYGRFFNRLNEVEVGDHIIVNTPEAEYTYQAYEIKIVEPTDLSVLNRNSTHRVITLITCDPIYVATHRLIVHGVLINEERR